MYRKGITIASIAGALAVVFGAFGAHILKESLTPSSLAVWKTAVEYHFYHTLAILLVSMMAGNIGHKNVKIICMLFLIGMIFFSGSLYLLSTIEITAITGLKLLGPVTPLWGDSIYCRMVDFGLYNG